MLPGQYEGNGSHHCFNDLSSIAIIKCSYIYICTYTYKIYMDIYIIPKVSLPMAGDLELDDL